MNTDLYDLRMKMEEYPTLFFGDRDMSLIIISHVLWDSGARMDLRTAEAASVAIFDQWRVDYLNANPEAVDTVLGSV